ncbi:MAG: DegT/DnrJ/EryC1/StrS family aminotransferase, partial [Gemmatimonadales bacterium]
MSTPPPRILLSTPHLGPEDEALVVEAMRSNWIAPLGPMVDAFEAEFSALVGSPHAVALSSGTAALHLALIGVGVQPGDEVFVSTLTFAGSVNPICYLGARPVLLDSEPTSWNMDPDRLEAALETRARSGRLPRAVVPVHLYGQPADMARILAACDRYGVPVIEDAAECLGATWQEKAPGTLGRAGVFSFNGNKIITTSGGGMLVTADPALAALARKLATQARDPAPHYQHSMVGYNYRLSNLLAALGRGQLRVLADRVAARRAHFDAYAAALSHLPGVAFMPEATWGRHTRWLTTLTIDPVQGGIDRQAVAAVLDS